MKLIIQIIKTLLKRLFCKHTYKQLCKCFRTDRYLHADIVIDYDFECTKCGHRTNIKMDTEYQVQGIENERERMRKITEMLDKK